MNVEIGARWIQALESGRFRKGRCSLHVTAGTEIDEANDSFCCLGVLCRLAVADGVDMKVGVEPGAKAGATGLKVGYDEAYGLLPESVREWAGMEHELSDLPKPVNRFRTLADMNDRSTSFTPLVEAIRTHMAEL